MSTSSSSISTQQESISKWNDNSQVKDIVDSTTWPKEAKERAKPLLESNYVYTLKDWMKVTPEQKKEYPIGLVNLLDEDQKRIHLLNQIGITDEHAKKLNRYKFDDILALSKEDLKSIFDVESGILYANRLEDIKKTEAR